MNLVIIGEAAENFKNAISKRRDDVNIATFASLGVFEQALSSHEIECDRLILSEDAITVNGTDVEIASDCLTAFKELLETHYTGVQVVLLLKQDVYTQTCTDVLYDTDVYAVFCVGSSLNVPFLVHTATMDITSLRSTYANYLYQEPEQLNIHTYDAAPLEVSADEEFDDRFVTGIDSSANSIAGDGEYEAYTVAFDSDVDTGESNSFVDEADNGYNTNFNNDFDNGLDEYSDYDTAVEEYESNGNETAYTYNEDAVTNADRETSLSFDADDFDYDAAVHEYNSGVEEPVAEELPAVSDDFDDFGVLTQPEFDETPITPEMEPTPVTIPKPAPAPPEIASKPTPKPKTASTNRPTNNENVVPQEKPKTKAPALIKAGGKRKQTKPTTSATTTAVNTPISYKYTQLTQGTQTATIVVTGDRRAGLTTTAMSVAEHFAQYVPTLYVDYDTKYRGSLSYLSVNELTSSSNIIQNGLGVLKPGRNIRTVTFKSDENVPFDSLVSLPNYALTDEQLIQAQLQLFYQREYNVVVLDCPFTNLYLLEDVLGQATVYICVTGDIANSSSTLLTLDALNPNAESALDVVKPMTEKGIAMLSRAQYLITGTDTKQFGGHMSYLDGLYGLSESDINWAKLPVAGTTQDLNAVLQQMP